MVATFFANNSEKRSSRLELETVIVVAHDPRFIRIGRVDDDTSVYFTLWRALGEGRAEGECGGRHDSSKMTALHKISLMKSAGSQRYLTSSSILQHSQKWCSCTQKKIDFSASPM